MSTACTAGLNARRYRDATELNNGGMTKFGDVHYQTEPNLSTFSDRDLINDKSSLCSQILLTTDLYSFCMMLDTLTVTTAMYRLTSYVNLPRISSLNMKQCHDKCVSL